MNRPVLKSLIFGVCWLLSFQAGADFNQAMKYYGEEKYPEAKEIFERLAQLGQHDSQFNIGVMYYHGQGVEKDLVEAYGWFCLAAEGGDPKSLKIRDLTFKKLPITRQTQALERCETLRGSYGVDALNMSLLPELTKANIAYCDVKRVKAEAPSYPKVALHRGEQGWVDVELTITKDGYTKDFVVLESLPAGVFDETVMEAVARFKYAPPMINNRPVDIFGHRARIIFLIDNGEPTDVQKKKLQQYLDEILAKAEAGNPGYQYLYAYLRENHPYLQDIGLSEANGWYLKAAKGGYAPAQYKVAYSLLYGQGCEIDNKKAIEWLTLAAKSDYPNAQLLLARVLLWGDDDKDRLEKAVFWLDKAASKGFAPAKVELAWLLSTQNDARYRDGERAWKLIEPVYEDYPDRPTAFDTVAAVYANLGDFKAAIKFEKKALKVAEKLEWNLEPMQRRLAAYEKQQPWRE